MQNPIIPVTYSGHYDCGFDPRFTFDGENFNTKKLHKGWKERCAFVKFKFLAYFSFSSTKRKQFKAVLKCAKTEYALAKVDRKWCAFGKNYMEIGKRHSEKEHDFFEASSALCKVMSRPGIKENLPLRLFPIEILTPIHAINKPQNPLETFENLQKEKLEEDALKIFGEKPIKERRQNGDLGRLTPFGFSVLSPDCKQKEKKKYVEHVEFIEQIQPASDELKKAVRSFRKFIYNTTSNTEKRKDFKAWSSKLDSKTQRLQEAWQNYYLSHELLTKSQKIFEEADIYKNFYKHKGKKRELFYYTECQKAFDKKEKKHGSKKK